jgi:hypothetical protein
VGSTRLIGALIPPIIITSMMVAALLITVTFENQVPPATQQTIATQMPFMTMPTGGNLVLSFGGFLLATLAADLAIFLPLFFLGRRDK